MKGFISYFSRYLLVGTIFSTLFLLSCEVSDPTGTIVFENSDDCIYECYFDGVLLGSVSNLSSATFEVDAICAKAETMNEDYGSGELEACVPDGGTYTVEINLPEPTGTITFDNFMSCRYDCYFDGEKLGSVAANAKETFTVEVRCGKAEVKTEGDCGDGYKDDVCIVKDENYTLNIKFNKKSTESSFDAED